MMSTTETGLTNEIREDEIKVNVVKRPKRIIYFSDGTMEESSDEDDRDKVDGKLALAKSDAIDESQLTWGPWISHKLYETGCKLVSSGETVGGAFSSFFGISTPKYSYELEQYRKIKAEQDRLAKEDMESASWLDGSPDGKPKPIITVQNQLKKY